MKNTIINLILVFTFSAAVMAQSSPETGELTRLLNEFLAGAGRNDAAVHDRFWAEDLIYTRGAGQRVGKADIMKGVREAPAPKPDDPKTVYTAEDIRVQQYGSTAVVAFRLVGTTENGGSISVSKFLNTGTFVKRKGKWQAVAWQATKIPAVEEDSRKQVAETEAAYQRAILASDTKKLESLLHPSFIWTHTTGQQDNREKMLGELTSGKLKYSKLETNSITINIYGDTAIVRGTSPRQRAAVPGAAEQPKPFTVFYTLTLVNSGGMWKIVAMHTSHT
ncbi:MAG: nuclear transport factor 2 family protein [Pyrinomonadaceae bacterium]